MHTIDKGIILFFNVRSIKNLYSRYSVHKEAITAFEFLPQNGIFVSYSAKDNILNLWHLQLGKGQVDIVHSFKMVVLFSHVRHDLCNRCLVPTPDIMLDWHARCLYYKDTDSLPLHSALWFTLTVKCTCAFFFCSV